MMSEQKLPIGLLLQKAGLISSQQLEAALKVQQQHSEMKLGDILVLRDGIKPKTIDFFANRWQDFVDRGQQFPIGYYLQKAFLLNKQQIEVILAEQEYTPRKFGEIAVEKGWLSPQTVEFFLQNLPLKPPEFIGLSELEQYNEKALHLEKKYANHSLILSRIIAWTGGNAILSKTIARLFARANYNIPDNAEIQAVDRFVENSLIKNWRTAKEAEYIRVVAQNLINNPRCDTKFLLKEYQQILLSEDRRYQDTPEQNELLLLGLIVPINDTLQVANIIYQQVFGRDFITQQLKQYEAKTNITNIEPQKPDLKPEIEPQALENTIAVTPSASVSTTPIVEPKIVPVPNSNPQANQPSNTPEPLTRMSSLITLATIMSLIPLFIIVGNYYTSLSKSARETAVEDSATVEPTTENRTMVAEEFCRDADFVDLPSTLKSIATIELYGQQLNSLPSNCNTVVNRMRVMVAPLLGKENRILEAIRHLCQVPDDSSFYVDAEVWLERWYRSASWGRETKLYLEHLGGHGDNCPAVHFLEHES